MARKGTLNFESFGYAMPAAEPLFKRPPFRHHGVDALSLVFETDYDTVSRIVPAELEFTHDTPRATLLVEYFRNALIPNYYEAILMLHCNFEGIPCFYTPSILVTAAGAMVTGREVWGFPKKPALITLEKTGQDIRCSLKRPGGSEIADISLSVKERLERSLWKNMESMMLKIIPSAEEQQLPDICQLVACRYDLEPEENEAKETELWRAEANVKWGGAPQEDPWDMVPFVNLLEARCGVFQTSLGYGRVVHDYLK